MSKPEKNRSSDSSKGVCIIVYGYDDGSRPKAARFEHVTNRKLLSGAAETMGLALCEATSPALAEIANKLPVGRLYSNGNGFVPFVRNNVYEMLIAELNGSSAKLACSAQGLPSGFDEIDIGHLVIAQENSEYGWWEAVVVKKEADMLTLRWRDYPRQPAIVRHRSTVALLNPTAP